MLSREILKFRSSEIAGNMYLASYFYIFKAFKEATKVHEKGQFARVFHRWGYVLPVPPGFYVHG